MERIKSLNTYQKGILLIMTAMALIFAVIYPRTIARVGYRYNDVILVPSEENGNTVYSGKIQGQEAVFTVSDNTVAFRHGNKTYGPYTVEEDATAVPKDSEMSANMTGIEVREGNDILFRGGALDLGEYYVLFKEDGSPGNFIGVSYTTSDGIERDMDGNPIDRLKPSASTIYELVNDPELTHKGIGYAWFVAVFVCIMNAVSILFADELFRWNLSFQIRNAERAEPSDWELAGRYIGWTVLTFIALILFIMGLQ